MHDPRLGRFFAVDPLTAKYPWNSPYAFSENRVVDSKELEGAESQIVIFNYSSGAFSVSKIQLEKDGPLGNGVAAVILGTDLKRNVLYGLPVSGSSTNSIVTSDYKVSNALINFKIFMEGSKDKLYYDENNNPTIGVGHLITEDELKKYTGVTLTQTEINTLFRKDVEERENTITSSLKGIVLTQTQMDALMDFNYNTNKIAKFVNSSDKSGKFFLRYMSNSDGVDKRRYSEYMMFEYGQYIGLDYQKNHWSETKKFKKFYENLLKENEFDPSIDGQTQYIMEPITIETNSTKK